MPEEKTKENTWENLQKLKDEELKELLGGILKNTKIRLAALTPVFLILLFLKIQGSVDTPRLLLGIIALFIFTTFVYDLYFKKYGMKQAVNVVSITYLSFRMMEATLLLLSAHFGGVLIAWGVIPVIAYLIFSYFAFTQAVYPRILAFLIIIEYIILVLAEYFGIWESVDPYGFNIIKNELLFKTSMVFIPVLLVTVTFYGDSFSRKLWRSLINFRIKEVQLEESKSVLEVKIKARTKELEETAASLEEQVQKRTIELQERVNELEKLLKLTVGREIKMIELKKEIDQLKEELRQSKGRVLKSK